MKLRIQSNQMEEVEGLHNEYPYAYHHVDLQNTDVPWHWHEALEFNLILEGALRVSTPTQTLCFQKGEAFFVNSNVLASMEKVDTCILDSHLFHPVLLSGHFKSVFETKYLNPVIQNRHLELIPLRGEDEVQRRIFGKLRQLSNLQKRQDTEFETRNLLSEIWLLLLEALRNTDSSTYTVTVKNQDRILSMMSFIQENFAEKLTLEEIAASAAISTRECLRCFRTLIRQSPIEYLMDYRVQTAKKLLESTDLTVTDIALRCGFNSSSYFTKQFHRLCGKTPAVYRKERLLLNQDTLSAK